VTSDKLGQAHGRVKCHACSGWFSLGFMKRRGGFRGDPVAYHSLPYCAAFDAIETTVDAARFSEKCRSLAPAAALRTGLPVFDDVLAAAPVRAKDEPT
jgi:hypothetical protein